MANTKLKHLPTASLSQVTQNGNFYLYMVDLGGEHDYKFQSKDFFTSVNSAGSGTSLISRSALNSVTLKSLSTASEAITIEDGSKAINVNIVEGSIDLNKCNNANASFLKSVNLASDVSSILPIINGGTGADDQASALNLITNSASGTVNQVLKTDATSASWAGVNDLITAGIGLAWNTSTTPYTLNADFSAVTFGADVVINNNVSISGTYNFAVATGWISNDGTNEGIKIDSTGRVFMGPSTPTAVFDSTASAALTLGANISFADGATRSINMVSPSSGAGNEFQILGSAPTASNQAGGAVTIKGGAATGSGAGGAVNLYAGDSGSGDGDINIYVTDAGTVSQVMKIHGSNKHFTIGSTGANNGAVLDIQNDTAGAACLELDQNDTDEPFIIYTGSTGTTGAANIDTVCEGDTSGSTVAGPHSATWTIKGMYRVNINGTDYWTPYYTR